MEPSQILLFAQQMTSPEFAVSGSPLVSPGILLPIVAMLIPIIVVPTALGIRYARQAREMEHLERMKALEMGRHLSDEDGALTPMGFAMKLGAGVPASVFGIAWLTSFMTHDRNVVETAWIGAGSVGVVAVICGSLLAFRAFGLDYRLRSEMASAARKPSFDPDAYDHIGTRG